MTARRFLLLLIALGAAALIWGYAEATSTPVERHARVRLADWPKGAPAVRLVLISDIHVGGPDMPPERLERIVEQVNALSPDLVLIAGDFITDKSVATRLYPMSEAIAPLAALRPRIASVAVMGNHDHWTDAAGARAALAKAGVRVLDNDAVQAGPVAVGGLDDAFTGRHDLAATLAGLRALPGAKLLLSHSPDPFAELPPDIGLMLAGHTHCGQVAPPLIGPIETMSRYGRRYACGIVREGGKVLVLTAGLGTSGVPLRIGARPDLWVLEVGGED